MRISIEGNQKPRHVQGKSVKQAKDNVSANFPWCTPEYDVQ